MTVKRTLHTGLYLHHYKPIQHLKHADIRSWLEFCRCINVNPQMFCNILFTDEVHFNDNEFNTTRNSNILDHDNPCGTVKSEYQYCFSHQCVMWHHWWITGPYIFPQSLIGDIYAKLLQHILPAIPLQEGSTMNMTSDVLPVWCTVHSYQSDCHAVSESATSRSWC